MSTRGYTSPFPVVGNVRNIIWGGLLNGDVGEAYTCLGRWDTVTVQVTGTFGAGGNVRIEASNDTGAPTWYTVTNITAAGITVINAGYYQVRVNITAGDGTTNLTATMVVTESTPDEKNLDDLLDVVISSPADTQVLRYNATTAKWENGSAGGGGIALNDLTDVIITTPVSNHILRYNGTNWVNVQLAHSDLSGIGTNAHSVIDTHLASTSSPHGATLTQTTLNVTTLNLLSTPNTFFGYEAGRDNSTGVDNSFFGLGAGKSNTTGSSNSCFGRESGMYNTTGYSNSCFGMNSGFLNTTGVNNVFVGLNAGRSNTTGSSNCYIGINAGRYQANGTTALQTANSSIYIGVESRGFNNSDSNSIVIGTEAIGIGANTVVLGNDSIVTTALKGKVGIGITPTAVLHLKAGTAINAPLKFTSPGTLLTALELGAVEFVDNGTTGDFYITTNVASITTRRAISLATGWTSYTPVVTSETGGWTNYTATGYYRVVDKMLKVSFRVVFSGASAAASSLYVSLPTGLTMNASAMAGGTGWDVTQVGYALLGDSGTISGIPAFITTRTNQTVLVKYYNAAAASYLTGLVLSDTAPWTWTTSDEVVGEFTVPIL